MKRDQVGSHRGVFSRKDRFQYWFDNRMSRGFFSLIRLLIAVSVVLALVIACLILVFHFDTESDTGSVFWNSISTLINAEMPSFEDGLPGYVLLMTISALAGVLFTSVLIGIITSAFEEKLLELKNGNSRVLERDHTVILGFYPGEYTLIRQLILAAAGKPFCLVIADDMDRSDMERIIKDNIDAPKSFRIICRSADICEPSSLEKCSLETCKTIIIAPTEDTRIVKTILAVSALLQKKGNPDISVNAILSRDEYSFPPSLAERHHITALQTNETLAKMIAHTCTQTGLSETFREIFNFEGSELYLVSVPEVEGLCFEEVMERLDRAVPVGLYRDGRMKLNPDPRTVLAKEDRLLVFSEEKESAVLTKPIQKSTYVASDEVCSIPLEEDEGTFILGYNNSLSMILKELPENVVQVTLVGVPSNDMIREKLEAEATGRNMVLRFWEGARSSQQQIYEVAQKAKHIVILNDHDLDDEAADLETIFLLLRLRDLRTRFSLQYNITAEMRTERNQNLVADEDHVDYIVASSMSSLILAQLAESPELIDAFREILSNEGNEIYLKSAELFSLSGRYSVRDIRRRLLQRGYIFLGYINRDLENHFNLPLEDSVECQEGVQMIVLGEN